MKSKKATKAKSPKPTKRKKTGADKPGVKKAKPKKIGSKKQGPKKPKPSKTSAKKTPSPLPRKLYVLFDTKGQLFAAYTSRADAEGDAWGARFKPQAPIAVYELSKDIRYLPPR